VRESSRIADHRNNGQVTHNLGRVTSGSRHDAIARAHAAAVAAGEPGYVDPETGFFVFTAVALAAKGECCDRGCRHCPYRAPM
jgi:Family of unknown function (DUF5522)